MGGMLTTGLPFGATFTGLEQGSFDTQLASGAAPQTITINVQQLATLVKFYNNTLDKTTVSGSRYYASYDIGGTSINGGATLTGIEVLVGGTGGTDLWIFELHNSLGALVATTSLSGTTAGTANTWQRIAFTAPVQVLPGSYFIAVQSNGTTAKPATYNSPQSSLVTGSATGVFGTSAAITPPTTYTANLGPMALAY